MKIMTRKGEAATAAERYRKQYGIGDDHEVTEQKAPLLYRLLSLGSSPSPEQVNEVMGNGSWTRLTCDECEKEVEQVIQLGQEPDYESHTAWICNDCMTKAVFMLTQSSFAAYTQRST